MTVRGRAYRILTPRLCLRPWEPRDAPAMVESMTASHTFLKNWLLWAENEPTGVDDKIELFRKFRGWFDAGTDFIYSAWTRDEQTLVGGSGLHFRVYEGGVEIGYWMDARHLRRGYATEITAALTRVAFEIEGVDRVEVHVDTRNEASFAVPRKLGFEHVATLPRSVKHPAGVGDRMIWMMLRERFTPTVEVEAFDAAGRPISTDPPKAGRGDVDSVDPQRA